MLFNASGHAFPKIFSSAQMWQFPVFPWHLKKTQNSVFHISYPQSGSEEV
jgi:hypothetical protein